MAIINGIGRVGIRSIAAPSGGGYTTRTTAFAAATGIADTTILNALNTFDTGLISNGLDTKMKALYPFVGGTSNTHRYNFMDARDLDAAFRITWFGGITHNASGVTGNGTNGYGNTNLIPSTTLSQNNVSIGVNISSNYNGVAVDFGSAENGLAKALVLQAREAGTLYYQVNASVNSFVANASSIGLWTLSRLSSTSSTIYKNGSSFNSNSAASTGLSSFSLCLFAVNQANNIYYPSPRTQNFAFISNGLNSTEVTSLSTLITAFGTSLGR